MLAAANARGKAIVLRPSRRKWALLLVCSLVITVPLALSLAVGLYVLQVVGLLLFGSGVVFSALQLVPGRAYLRIAPDGLVVWTPFGTRRWAWNGVEHFRVYEIHHRYHTSKHVGFDRRDLTPERQSLWHTINRGMSGVDVSLPDTYGMDHHELAELLNDACARYATEHGISASGRADRALEEAAARISKDRVPAVTVLLAVACLALFVVEVDAYGAFPTAAELREAGGASMDALQDGDWWTLLYANLLHADPFHLIFNLIALVLLGVLLEREIGWARMAYLCLAGGLGAAILGVLLAFGAVLVGVSGVIFGIAGWAVVRDTHRTRALGIVALGDVAGRPDLHVPDTRDEHRRPCRWPGRGARSRPRVRAPRHATRDKRPRGVTVVLCSIRLDQQPSIWQGAQPIARVRAAPRVDVDRAGSRPSTRNTRRCGASKTGE